MKSYETGTEWAAEQMYLKRRELIKIQLEKQILGLVREIVNEKLAMIDPIIDELEALDKIKFTSPSKGE